ncbi:MAG: four helix bundle protein [Planctomycetota bacterium]
MAEGIEPPQASSAQRSAELQARTKSFAVRCLRLIDSLPNTTAGRVIGNQLARSATSVGANYRASCRARSRKEFVSKMSITVEEADESLYWLELIVELKLVSPDRLDTLLDEANQLVAIFAKSRSTARKSINPAQSRTP